MYTPATMREERLDVLLKVIEDFPFATVITTTSAEPMISHIPMLAEARDGICTLFGHLARANSHWRVLEGGAPTTVIFQGPHGYVSPNWYETHPSVPTWNYVAVHVHGRATILDASETETVLRRLVEKFEAGRAEPWPGALPAEFLEEELKAIVGFRIVAERIEGKFKLSQNRSGADRERVVAGLQREGDPASHALAAFMLSLSQWAG